MFTHYDFVPSVRIDRGPYEIIVKIVSVKHVGVCYCSEVRLPPTQLRSSTPFIKLLGVDVRNSWLRVCFKLSSTWKL